MQAEKIECDVHGSSPIEYAYSVKIGFHRPECKVCYEEAIEKYFKLTTLKKVRQNARRKTKRCVPQL